MSQKLDSRSRAEFVAWSEPVCADLISERHERGTCACPETRQLLSAAQSRFWKALLSGDRHRFMPARRLVASIRVKANMAQPEIDAVDDEVLHDLSELVTARFLRTPAVARAYGQVLLEAALALGTMRGAEAMKTGQPPR